MDISTNDILTGLSSDIKRIIGKLIHVEYQPLINKQINRQVEKIEDACRMDNLKYVHLHAVCNLGVPFLDSDSYMKQSYKWVHETYNSCSCHILLAM